MTILSAIFARVRNLVWATTGSTCRGSSALLNAQGGHVDPTPSARFIICMSLGLSACLNLAVPIAAHAQANSWTNTLSGNWEDGVNWSLGLPPSISQSATFVSNGIIASVKTITINGTIIATNMTTTIGTAAAGSLTINGGRMLATNMVLGNLSCTATGTVIVAGGSLLVTNAATNAALEVRSGSLWLNDGTLVVDQL